MAKIKPGEPITADFLNGHEDAAVWYRRQKKLGEGSKPVKPTQHSAVVTVRNGTGDNLRRGEVIGLASNPLDARDPLNLYYEGGLYDPGEAPGWAITLDPHPAGKFGDCLTAGPCVAWVDVSDESHKYAAPLAGSSMLVSAEVGPVRIDDKPEGTGELECSVLIGSAGSAQTAIVQVYHDAGTQGKEVEPNADKYHPGFVKQWNSGTLDAAGECWIRFVDQHDQLLGNVKVKDGDCFHGRVSGTVISEGDERRLFLARRGGGGETLERFELKDDLQLGEFAEAYKCILSGGDWIKTEEVIIVHDPYKNPGCWMGYGPEDVDGKGYQGFCVARLIDNETEDAADDAEDEHVRYEIVWMERPALIVEGQATEDRSTDDDQFTIRISDSYQQGNKNPPDAEDGEGDNAGFKIIQVFDQQPRFGAFPSGTKVMAIWDDASRRYRAVHVAIDTTAPPIVEWREVGTKDTALASAQFSAADDSTLYFSKRIGPADIGVTHDPAVSSPKTDGNFTCTKDGRYKVTMWWIVGPNGTWSATGTNNHNWSISARLGFRIKVSGGSSFSTYRFMEHNQPYDTGQSTTVQTVEITFQVNLSVGDKIHLLAQGLNAPSGGTGNAFEIDQAQIIFENLGAQVAEVSIP